MFRIALRFLLFDRPKTIGALAGTIISVFLIGQQSGIFIFLTNAMSAYVRNNTEYIWVTDEKTTNANAMTPLDNRISRQIESIAGVKKAHQLVIAGGSAKFPNGTFSGLTLIGVQYPDCAGGPWNLIEGNKQDMIKEGGIITDFFDTKALGGAKIGDYFEYNGKKAHIVGNTKGVRSFGGGVLGFTTIEQARYLTNGNNNKSSCFLISYDPAIPREQIIYQINTNIKGVRAWKSEDFANETILTVLKSSGIAISFGTLIVFALIVGFVIIGLTLYSAAIDRIRDYGTLKAIGATNWYIRKLIMTQAMIIAVVGFGFGFLLVNAFKNGIANAGTLFEFPLWMQFAFFGITLFIAFFGSSFAIRRIVSLEPSAVFRG
jgi:putative ABC transport system permease protein